MLRCRFEFLGPFPPSVLAAHGEHAGKGKLESFLPACNGGGLRGWLSVGVQVSRFLLLAIFFEDGYVRSFLPLNLRWSGCYGSSRVGGSPLPAVAPVVTDLIFAGFGEDVADFLSSFMMQLEGVELLVVAAALRRSVSSTTPAKENGGRR